MVRDRRICDALASIYDGREPRLFKDKLIYKPPHSRKHGLHQDYNWWQGCMLTAPAQFGTLSRELSDPSMAVQHIAQPGDALMFHCFTPHEAGPNRSDRYRRQVFLTYNDSADGEHYQAHLEHHHWYRMRENPPERQASLYFR